MYAWSMYCRYLRYSSIVVTVNFFVLFQEFETNGSYDTEKSRTTGSLKTKLRFQDKGGCALIRIYLWFPVRYNKLHSSILGGVVLL